MANQTIRAKQKTHRRFLAMGCEILITRLRIQLSIANDSRHTYLMQPRGALRQAIQVGNGRFH